MGERLHELFETARDRVSERKLRLFAVACCRRLLSSPLLDVAERVADGQASEDARVLAEAEAFARFVAARDRPAAEWSLEEEMANRALTLVLERGAYQALDAAELARRTRGCPEGGHWVFDQREEAKQCALLRDVVGFPVRFDPAWRVSNDHAAATLAATIYAEQAWDLMPILGDALEEAGCTDEAILAHCRGPDPHVRGCWVVDLILGRE